MKELWIAAHEELIEEYLEQHPDADWTTASEAVTDATQARYVDKWADMIDAAKDRAKSEGNWPPRRKP